MKTRFIAVLLGVFIIPNTSFATVPTIDPGGTSASIVETVQTILSKVENSQQVLTLQQTMAKIGSAKETISSFINNQKDVITKYKEKMETYINKGKEYAEKAKAYKEEAEKYIDKGKQAIDTAKEIKEQGVSGYLKDNAGGLISQAAGQIGIEGVDPSKVEKITNQAIDTIETGDSAKDIAGEKAEDLDEDKNIVQDESNQIQDVSDQIKTDKSEEETTENTAEKETKKEETAKEDITTEENKMVPTRASFKSSFGYGYMQKEYKLSFASMSDVKTGETPEGILVIPESVSMHCDLDYNKAVEKGKIDECLRQINTTSTSFITEDITKKEIDDASTAINNGFVEYLTSTFFDALDIYNESLTFKNNELSPVLTSSTSDIDASWRIAKEMHLVLGDRMNRLRKLWAKDLSMKMYLKYMNERFVNKQE